MQRAQEKERKTVKPKQKVKIDKPESNPDEKT